MDAAREFQLLGISGFSYSFQDDQKVLCPVCSSTRKNKFEKCLSINIEKGTYHCFNCDWSGSVYTKQFKSQELSYKPSPESVYKYFEARGITKEVVDRNKIGVIALHGKAHIVFPYNYNDKLVNAKFRSREKDYSQIKDADQILYKMNDVVDSKEIIITEGECFPPDAELMTEKGFVRFDEYIANPTYKVMQVTEELVGELVEPIAIIKKAIDSQLFISNCNSHYIACTLGHNINTWKADRVPLKLKAKDFYKYKGQLGIQNTLNSVSAKGIPLTDDEIKLFVAVSADFTIREKRDIYGTLTKERKKIRFREILNSLSIPFSEHHQYVDENRTKTSFFIRRGDAPSYLHKLFPMEWTGQLSSSQIDLILKEIVLWDGNTVPNRQQVEYSSIQYNNIKFVQTLAHLNGYTSTIIRRENALGKWYKLSILFSKQTSSSSPRNRSLQDYKGDVFCVTVPSGKILIRQGEKICVIYNCDSLAFEVAGYKNAVSIPSGAIQANASTVGKKLDFIDNCYDILNSKQTFYLALDNDPHGIRTRNEIAKRLGEDKCLIVNFPDGCKDANETLIKFGTAALASAIECAVPFPIDGLKPLDESISTIQYIYEHGFTKGADTPDWKKFSELITFHSGAVTVITGIPGFGKSTFLDNAVMQLSLHHGWKFAVMSSESNPTRHALSLAKMFTGKAILPHLGGRATKEEFDEALSFLKKHIYHITPTSYDEYTVDKFLGYVELAYKRYGVNAAILDPWGRMNNEFRNDSETHFISKAISKFQHFCKRLNIHLFIIVHPRKQEEKDLKKGEDVTVKQMYKRPTLYDINGSASWFNLCDNGIVVHQIVQDDKLYNRIYVDKVKFDDWGHVGFVDFEYRKACSRYVENHFELNESYSKKEAYLYDKQAPF